MILPSLVPSIALLSFGRLAEAAAASEWASRSIYQVMTDRFAVTNGSDPECDLLKYCGGTWAGLRNKLDYIQGMGFTAIQISPVVKNFPEDTVYGEAFHGYWPQDWYALNENFGTADDLKDLAKELHDRDMYLMVDVVINDMAVTIKEDMTPDTVIDYSKFNPFNDAKYYHPWCNLTSYFDIPVAQKCWLGSSVVALPDLDTENPVVESMINDWIKELVSNYSIDGLRIDAAKHVNDEFLHSFVKAAGVFTFGEVYNVDVKDVCRYQDFMDGVPNFPVYFPLIEAFANGNMFGLGDMVKSVPGECKNISYLGTFAENHDLPRFASLNPDLTVSSSPTFGL
jgi:alpha-amylase